MGCSDNWQSVWQLLKPANQTALLVTTLLQEKRVPCQMYESENAECTFHGSALRTTWLELGLSSRTTWYAARSTIHRCVWIGSDSVTCQSVMRAIIPSVKNISRAQAVMLSGLWTNLLYSLLGLFYSFWTFSHPFGHFIECAHMLNIDYCYFMTRYKTKQMRAKPG